MIEITFNEFIFVAFFFATLINLLSPAWKFNWKEVTTSFLIAILAWITTQYFIKIEPHVLWTQVLYIIGCIAIFAAPIQVYNTIKEEGLTGLLKGIKAIIQHAFSQVKEGDNKNENP